MENETTNDKNDKIIGKLIVGTIFVGTKNNFTETKIMLIPSN